MKCRKYPNNFHWGIFYDMEEGKLLSIWEHPLSFFKEWFAAVIHPAFLIGTGMVVVYVWARRRYEIKNFASVLEPKFPLLLQTVSYSLIVGFFGSLCLSGIRWEIQTGDWLLVWSLTLILAAFGLRFACLAYSVGILSIIHLCVSETTWLDGLPVPGLIHSFPAKEWLWLVAVSHLLEWALIRLDGENGAYPVKVKQVSGFMLKKGWPVPLLLSSETGFILLPVFLSFSRINLSGMMKKQKRQTSTFTLLYGLILCLGLTFLDSTKPGIWVMAVFAVLGHEGIYLGTKWIEKRATPLYVSNHYGVKVLAVIPDSPAEAMGLKTGDVIQRFNGRRIRSMDELTQVAGKATHCKLDVLDENQNQHITQKALYEDDPADLGVIPALPVEEDVQVRSTS